MKSSIDSTCSSLIHGRFNTGCERSLFIFNKLERKGTWGSKRYLVCFHLLTIFTHQGHISQVGVASESSKYGVDIISEMVPLQTHLCWSSHVERESRNCISSVQSAKLPQYIHKQPVVVIGHRLMVMAIIAMHCQNIARGTTDPGYWVHNSNHLPGQITLLIARNISGYKKKQEILL